MARFDWPFAASVLIVMRSSRSVIATPASAIPGMAGEATRPNRRCVNLDVALRANYAVAVHVGLNPVVYLEVPHEGLIRSGVAEAHTQKKHWHEHVNFFTVRGLARLLARAGFRTLAQH